MKKFFYLFVLMAIFSMAIDVWAVTLTGKVVDEKGNAIPGTVITLTPKTGSVIEVTTDSDGRFTCDVPCDKYRITVKAEGFDKQKKIEEICQNTNMTFELVETDSLSSSDLATDPNDVGGGSCTHLYLLNDEGVEYPMGTILTAVGKENEKWESRLINTAVSGNKIIIRFVKEMPEETTFIDQVRLRVEETDKKSGEMITFYLDGEYALKNGAGANMRTAFLNDGNHISIKSSRLVDRNSKWGVKKGDILEVKFGLPEIKEWVVRKYYVMTFGYHIKKIIDQN